MMINFSENGVLNRIGILKFIDHRHRKLIADDPGQLSVFRVVQGVVEAG